MVAAYSLEPTDCIVFNCRKPTVRHVCDHHWAMLDLELKRRWWRETGYGKHQPDGELSFAISAACARKASDLLDE